MSGEAEFIPQTSEVPEVESQVTETPETSEDDELLGHVEEEEGSTEASETVESETAAPTKIDLPADIQAKLKRAEELEQKQAEYDRSRYVQEGLQRQQQEDQYKAELAKQEQNETRQVYAEMQRLGSEAEALAAAGRVEEAENKRVEALGYLNSYNSYKAEQRLVAKIQSAQNQQAQAKTSFEQDVQQFQADPQWGGVFCDPKKPEESRQIAMFAADLKAKGYPQQGIYQMLWQAKSLYGAGVQAQTQANAKAAADKARAAAGMESPTGSAPSSGKNKDDDIAREFYREQNDWSK